MISTRITYWSASRVDAEKYMKKTIKTPSCEEWKDYLQFSLFHSSPQPFHHFSLAESADGRKRSTFAKYLQEWAPKNIFMRRSYLQIRKPCITILAVLSKFLRRLQPEDVSLTLSKMVTWRWVAVEKKRTGHRYWCRCCHNLVTVSCWLMKWGLSLNFTNRPFKVFSDFIWRWVSKYTRRFMFA